jgi:hypothetical protein
MCIDDGNLEELKQIPKNKIPSDLIVKLENTLIDIESKICENIQNNECKYSLGYFLEQKYKIKSCISYLNKIK